MVAKMMFYYFTLPICFFKGKAGFSFIRKETSIFYIKILMGYTQETFIFYTKRLLFSTQQDLCRKRKEKGRKKTGDKPI
jgi:hypothetical protein